MSPPRPGLVTCLAVLIFGMAAFVWQDNRCHGQATTPAGHDLCQELNR